METVGADAGAEAESSEDARKAADIERHAEVAPQESAGVRAISSEPICGSVLFAPVGYDL
jgi:hypothetical protein